MPSWLDRVVPHLSIEGGDFFAERDRLAREADALLAGVSPPPEPRPGALL